MPDLSLSSKHPKRSFIRRAVDYEIRLSYYDRIVKTLPEPMQDPDVLVVPTEAPGPDFEYDDPGLSTTCYSAFSLTHLVHSERIS